MAYEIQLDNFSMRAEPTLELQSVILPKKRRINRFLSSNITSSTTDISSLRLSGLTIGKSYRIFAHAKMTVTSNSSGSFEIVHDGISLGQIAGGTPNESGNDRHSGFFTNEIIATATTVTFNFSEFVNCTLEGNNTTAETHTWALELDYDIEYVSSF